MIDYTEHIGLVHAAIKNLFGSNENARIFANKKGIDLDDLIQVGTIALWEAAEKFDESKGYKFSSYAFKCIRFTIMSEVNRNNPIYTPASTSVDDRREANDRVVSADIFGDDKRSVLATVASDINVEQEAISRVEAKRILAHLTERERYILLARLDKIPYREIGKVFGVSHEAVRQINNRTLAKLREKVAI